MPDKELESEIYIMREDLKEAHRICDALDVPKANALVSHRLQWYLEGKRESYKTSENTEGYPPTEWNKRVERLNNLLSGKHIKKGKLPVVNTPDTREKQHGKGKQENTKGGKD